MDRTPILRVVVLIAVVAAAGHSPEPTAAATAFAACTAPTTLGAATPASARIPGSAALGAGGPALEPVADVPLPGGTSRFDYQSFDPTTGRLYVAHMGAGEVIVFDTDASSVVGTVGDLPTVTGVLAVPELHRVYASVAGGRHVAAIDDRTLTVVARVGEIGFPDGLAYAPQTRQLFVSDESGGGELVIDAATDAVAATIDVGGEAGNTHYDAGSGCILVAVQSRNRLIAIEPATDAVVGRMELGSDCDGPHGFALDAAERLAFVSCEGSARLLVVDLDAAQVTATFPVGEGPDVLAFDPGLRRLYVASESGTVSVFRAHDGTLEPVGELSIPHAHSVAVDPATHLVYFPLQDIDGRPVLRIMAPATGDSAP